MQNLEVIEDQNLLIMGRNSGKDPIRNALVTALMKTHMQVLTLTMTFALAAMMGFNPLQEASAIIVINSKSSRN